MRIGWEEKETDGLMTELAIVYALFPSAGEAHDCCRTLLEEGLVACANRLAPVISHYRWQGEIETNEEHPVLFKTRIDLQQAAIDRIARLHRYDVPAALAWPVTAAHAPFAEWVKAETRQ